MVEKSERIKNNLEQAGLTVIDSDLSRPWGGFFVISEEDILLFSRLYFDNLNINDRSTEQKLSPKILMVAPGKRLSWQYHHRRAEVWKVIDGAAGVVVSDTDEETPLRRLKKGEIIRLNQGQRHRLVGLDDWAVVAEIWQHTDPSNPSNEEDIVRLQDDFGR